MSHSVLRSPRSHRCLLGPNEHPVVGQPLDRFTAGDGGCCESSHRQFERRSAANRPRVAGGPVRLKPRRFPRRGHAPDPRNGSAGGDSRLDAHRGDGPNSHDDADPHHPRPPDHDPARRHQRERQNCGKRWVCKESGIRRQRSRKHELTPDSRHLTPLLADHKRNAHTRRQRPHDPRGPAGRGSWKTVVPAHHRHEPPKLPPCNCHLGGRKIDRVSNQKKLATAISLVTLSAEAAVGKDHSQPPASTADTPANVSHHKSNLIEGAASQREQRNQGVFRSQQQLCVRLPMG